MIDLGPVFVAIACVLYVLYAARRSSDQASTDESGNLLFPLVPSFRIGLRAASLVFAGGALLSFLDRAPGWTTVMFACGAGISVAVPYVIVLSPQGIEYRRVLGIFTTRIGWADIELALEIPGEGAVIIQSKNGSSISHSRYHVDRERLLAEFTNRKIPVNRQGEF